MPLISKNDSVQLNVYQECPGWPLNWCHKWYKEHIFSGHVYAPLTLKGLISCESLAVVQRDLSECSEIYKLDFPLIISFFYHKSSLIAKQSFFKKMINLHTTFLCASALKSWLRFPVKKKSICIMFYFNGSRLLICYQDTHTFPTQIFFAMVFARLFIDHTLSIVV